MASLRFFFFTFTSPFLPPIHNNDRFSRRRKTQREPLGAQTVGEQQDGRRDEAPERLHVPLGDGRPGGRDPGAVQPVSAVVATQQPDVPADGQLAQFQWQGREKRSRRLGVRSAQRGHRQAHVVQAIAGRRRLFGRTACAQVRSVLLLGRGQQAARQGRQAQTVIIPQTK